MGRFIDMTNQVYGRLTVLSLVSTQPHAQWSCRCTCGKVITAYGNNLRKGNTKSCGCLKLELAVTNNTIHGHAGKGRRSKEYRSYHSMLERCYVETTESYPSYGGRGIAVCARWLGDGGFERFLSDMGPVPKGYTLERINNNKNYSPRNCRWATRKEQADNRRSSIVVLYRGRTLSLLDWAAVTGIGYKTLLYRYHAGKTAAELFRPVGE